MRIGVVGSGMIGTTLAALFAAGGHQVTISNRRGPASLAGLTARLPGDVTADTVQRTARAAELVVAAIPYRAYPLLPPAAFDRKTVVDAMNYYPRRDGPIPELDSDAATSSELVARHLDGARLVKAFNTMFHATLAEAGAPALGHGERLALYLAGDDAGAKDAVTRLIEQIGFAALDTGSLARGGRLQQPGAVLFGRELTGAQAAAYIDPL